MSTNTSPFKFLDAYTKEDKDIFFGREDEVEQLYDLVWQSHLTLVYGQSGTGKTSLVKCGLANRFFESDWFDLHVRRSENINISLRRNLKRYEIVERPEQGTLKERLMRKRQDVVRTRRTEQEADNEIIRLLRHIYKHYLKPIFLIFDQFEELYILGNREEQHAFYQTIAEILDSENYCRVIIIMREESIAQLYDFERVVPSLFDKRLRVEPMSRFKTKEVISRTAEKFAIGMGDDKVEDEIINLLAGGQGRVELTYLQVFLDQLYQEASAGKGQGIVFDTPLVRQLGDIDDVLGDFLGKQNTSIQQLAEKEFPGLIATAVSKVLNLFVTLEGTKRPVEKSEIQIGRLMPDQIDFIVKQLERRRILRYDNERFELAHDALARQIAGTRTADEITLLQIATIVNNRQREYAATRTLLNNNELGLITIYRRKLEDEQLLGPEKWAFVRKSRSANRRRRLMLAGIVLAVMASLAALALWANRERQNAQNSLDAMLKAQEEQRMANYLQYLNDGNAKMAQSRYPEAAQSYEFALTFDSTRTEARDSLTAARERAGAGTLFTQFITEGDSLLQLGETSYVDAMAKYREAFKLNFNNSLARGRINEMEGRLAAAFVVFKERGDNFYRAGPTNRAAYRYALEAYQQAARIRPDDMYIQNRISSCSRHVN